MIFNKDIYFIYNPWLVYKDDNFYFTFFFLKMSDTLLTKNARQYMDI